MLLAIIFGKAWPPKPEKMAGLSHLVTEMAT
jgi:hypothetical protein